MPVNAQGLLILNLRPEGELPGEDLGLSPLIKLCRIWMNNLQSEHDGRDGVARLRLVILEGCLSSRATLPILTAETKVLYRR